MTQELQTLINDVMNLPTEKLPRVAALVEALKQEGKTARVAPVEFSSDPFIGMWRDRKELEDSTAWVRSFRRSEW